MNKSRLGRWITLGVLVLLAAAAAIVVLLVDRPLEPKAARAMELAEKLDRVLDRPRAYDAPGVVVFALSSAADDKDLVFLGSALCDALVERLVRHGVLRSTSCASARVAREAGLRGPQLAHLLGTDFAVEGSIARAENGGYRVALAMRRLRTGATQWQMEGDYDDAGLQELIGEVTRRIVGAAAGGAPAPVEHAVDRKAYAKYLKALQLARAKNPDAMRAALALIEEVLAIAPDFSAALYVRLGLLSQLSQYRGEHTGSPQESLARQAALLEEIQALGRRLVQIDPADLRGNILLLNFAFQNRRWVDAFAHADVLMTHVTRSPGVLRIAARLHLSAGYLQRARELALQAARLDALNPETYEVLALIHGALGQDTEMLEFAAIATELGIKRASLFEAIAAHRRREWPAFERWFTQSVHSAEEKADWVPQFTRAMADAGEREAAARTLEQHDVQTRAVKAGYFLEYALLGETERSLRAVRAQAQLPPAAWLEHLWWPELGAIRQNPGFAEALENLGIVALWETRAAPDLCARAAGGTWSCR